MQNFMKFDRRKNQTLFIQSKRSLFLLHTVPCTGSLKIFEAILSRVLEHTRCAITDITYVVVDLMEDIIFSYLRTEIDFFGTFPHNGQIARTKNRVSLSSKTAVHSKLKICGLMVRSLLTSPAIM